MTKQPTSSRVSPATQERCTARERSSGAAPTNSQDPSTWPPKAPGLDEWADRASKQVNAMAGKPAVAPAKTPALQNRWRERFRYSERAG
jgi:hypothetical protein